MIIVIVIIHSNSRCEVFSYWDEFRILADIPTPTTREPIQVKNETEKFNNKCTKTFIVKIKNIFNDNISENTLSFINCKEGSNDLIPANIQGLGEKLTPGVIGEYYLLIDLNDQNTTTFVQNTKYQCRIVINTDNQEEISKELFIKT